MNPIDQMMECYGVEKKVYCDWTCKDSSLCNADCEHYNELTLFYPPFTAEKQIELIKLLAMIDTFAMRYWRGIFVCKVNGIYSSLSKKEGETNFANALAELVTELKKKLDYQRVKEILEG